MYGAAHGEPQLDRQRADRIASAHLQERGVAALAHRLLATLLGRNAVGDERQVVHRVERRPLVGGHALLGVLFHRRVEERARVGAAPGRLRARLLRFGALLKVDELVHEPFGVGAERHKLFARVGRRRACRGRFTSARGSGVFLIVDAARAPLRWAPSLLAWRRRGDVELAVLLFGLGRLGGLVGKVRQRHLVLLRPPRPADGLAAVIVGIGAAGVAPRAVIIAHAQAAEDDAADRTHVVLVGVELQVGTRNPPADVDVAIRQEDVVHRRGLQVGAQVAAGPTPVELERRVELRKQRIVREHGRLRRRQRRRAARRRRRRGGRGGCAAHRR